MRDSLTAPSSTLVISGLGAVTPYGTGIAALWQALLRGDDAISKMDLFDLGGIACARAGQIRHYIPPPGFEDRPRASGFAAGASLEALRQANLLDDPAARAATALITASNFGDVDGAEPALIPAGHPGHDPAAARHAAHAEPAAALARGFGLGGLRLSLSLSCSSGASAAATAAELILAGHAARALIVGYDAISRFSWSGLCALRTMTRDVVRPFDANRDGTIFSEGAAALVIERADACAARGAQPLARLAGWGTGNNGFHLTAPAPRGAGSKAVMSRALECAALPPEAVDHINAHGTGTQPNDATETQAILDLFGPRAAAIPVTAPKGLLGHLLGAAGSVELALAVLSLRHGMIPPTGHHETRAPDCPLDIVTSPRPMPLACALSNSAGFGGCNAAAVVLQPDPPCDPGAASPPNPTLPAAAPTIAITGIGLICALGADADEIALALAEGDSALAPLARFTLPEAAEPPLTGEAPDPDLAACGVSPKPYLDRASHLLLAACGMALRQARLDAPTLAEHQAGILVGTSWGCAQTAEAFFADYIIKGPRLVKPFLFPHAYSNTAVSLAAMEWSLTGPHENVAGGAASSGVALVEAVDLLLANRARILVAGGADALSATALRARAASGDPAPIGEAAAILILETEETAKARGARPLGRLLSAALDPDPGAAARAALARAALTPHSLHAVYANAAARDAALALCGEEAARSTDSLCGDTLGATTALHLACGLIAAPAHATILILTAEPGACAALIATL